MNISLRRHEITLQPESARVIIRLFAPNDVHRMTTIIGALIAAFGFGISVFVTRFFYLYITVGIIVGKLKTKVEI